MGVAGFHTLGKPYNAHVMVFSLGISPLHALLQFSQNYTMTGMLCANRHM